VPASAFGRSGESAIAALLASGEIEADEAEARRQAFARSEAMPFPTPPSARYWKRDPSTYDWSSVEVLHAGTAEGTFAEPAPPATAAAAYGRQRGSSAIAEVTPAARERGVVVTGMRAARSERPVLVAQAIGSALERAPSKAGLLARALSRNGAFIYVPAGVVLEAPILFDHLADGGDEFPHSLVIAGEGAQFTVVERYFGETERLICSLTEILAGPGSNVRYAAAAEHGAAATTLFTRRAICGADARVELAIADLGEAYILDSIVSTNDARGGHSSLAAVFFTGGKQHVDLSSEVRHLVGDTTSQTIVKSAGIGRGQGRYIGNIVIAANAHGADASLRDDVLLLSKEAHIDSIPALEIAANDVKAFHGATVGSIDVDELFYAQSRGLALEDAERMIALGFFEPAIAHFPIESVREDVRRALAGKLRGKDS
jgi:Fe-S cluster assembly protein SufD